MYLLSAVAILGIYVKFQWVWSSSSSMCFNVFPSRGLPESKNCFFWDIDIIVTLIIHAYLIVMQLHTFTF